MNYRIVKSKKQSTINLIMFPFAGGYCQSYNSLVSYLIEDINVILINPLGHFVDNRPLVETIGEMVDHYLSFLPSLEAKKTFYWGHSLGGLVVFEIVKRLISQGSIYLPAGIFLSAIKAPSIKSSVTISSESELLEYVLENKFIDKELLKNSELVSLILPALFADLKAVFTYSYDKS